MHLNIRSLNKNIDKLEEFLLELGKLPEIIALFGTKLKNSLLYFLDGYKFIQANSDTNAGGVGLFIRNNINFLVNNQYKLNVPNCENLWIEVKQNKKKQQTKHIWSDTQTPQSSYYRLSRKFRKIASKIK